MSGTTMWDQDDPYEEWLNEVVARYRGSLRATEPVGDDDWVYMVLTQGSTPTEMAEQFQDVLDAENLALLLAYAVRRCTFQEIDLELANEAPE